MPKADIPPVPCSAVRDCLGAARGFDFPLVVDRTEHQRSKFGFADYVCDFSERKEWDESDAQKCRHAERADHPPPPSAGKLSETPLP